jgi:hypothetical protein
MEGNQMSYREDEQPHVMVSCIVCNFRFDALLGFDCPSCRKARVQATFKPLDALRTADAMLRWHGDKPSWLNAPVETEDLPEDCNMPKYEDEQVYQLKRMFRL